MDVLSVSRDTGLSINACNFVNNLIFKYGVAHFVLHYQNNFKCIPIPSDVDINDIKIENNADLAKCYFDVVCVYDLVGPNGKCTIGGFPI